MAEHQIVKPEKLSATAVGMLEQELILPNLFQKVGFDEFKGARDDAVNVKVEGVLPYHLYKFRGDRDVANTAPEPHEGKIKFDEYAERTIQITMNGRAYSGVLLNDEQWDFDELQWGKLLRPQVKAVSRGLQRACVNEFINAPYEVTIGVDETKIRAALIEARRVLNLFRVPGDQRLLIVGTDFESALLSDEKLTLATNVGDSRADSALGNATMGRLLGFQVVVDSTIPSDMAYACVPGAMVFANAAPYVPQSVGFGATTSFEGVSLRWMRDYAIEETRDRSLVDCYYGFRAIKDVLVGWDEVNRTETVSNAEYFVRGVQLQLGGTDAYPEAGTELANITGVSAPVVVP